MEKSKFYESNFVQCWLSGVFVSSPLHFLSLRKGFTCSYWLLFMDMFPTVCKDPCPCDKSLYLFIYLFIYFFAKVNFFLSLRDQTRKNNTFYPCRNRHGRAWSISKHNCLITFLSVVCQVRFTSTYNNKVTGIVGASVNFTWTFTGKVRSAQLERAGKVLIVIDRTLQVLVPSSSHSGRISVVWDGRSPGRVTFLMSLRSIADEGAYQCTLYPEALDDIVASNRADLVVFGKFINTLTCPWAVVWCLVIIIMMPVLLSYFLRLFYSREILACTGFILKSHKKIIFWMHLLDALVPFKTLLMRKLLFIIDCEGRDLFKLTFKYKIDLLGMNKWIINTI